MTTDLDNNRLFLHFQGYKDSRETAVMSSPLEMCLKRWRHPFARCGWRQWRDVQTQPCLDINILRLNLCYSQAMKSWDKKKKKRAALLNLSRRDARTATARILAAR